MAYYEAGSRVWVTVRGVQLPATAAGSDGENSTFKADDGQEHTFPTSSLTKELVSSMHQSSIDGVEDMAKLGDLHTGAILHNIKLRYHNSEIYTFIGSILSAINPYKSIDQYGPEVVAKYKGRVIGELPPHIYAIANETYNAMWKSDSNQVVLISGESGAGKTESTKFILRFLSYMSNERTHGDSPDVKTFEDKILQSSPILEAFGNAKTLYNNNSSRFGKFMKVSFNSSGVIEGGRIIDYLLEKNRVVRQNPNERNFHIFYNLLVAGPTEKFKLARDPSKYYYLKQSGTWTVDGIDDKEDWKRIQDAFNVMMFGEQQQLDLLAVLAGILHLGNVTFIQAGGAQIADSSVVDLAAEALGLEGDTLAEMLTQQTRILRNEVISTPLDINQAADSRDSMAMALYSQAFKWVVKKVNLSLNGQDSFHSIGVLDIFGFENFEMNSFEQFNINYANEKLQQYFNRHIFSLEQVEYQREGISWAEIDWVDNSECLDLVERKLGILSLLDEESRFPKGTDESLLGKLHSSHGASSFYIRPRVQNSKFGIAHYAGEVMYTINGFLEKNRDTFREDLLKEIQNSTNDFVYDLFEHVGSAANSSGRTSTARKKPTVSFQFKDSLSHLMQTLGSASPYFVRCLKPNPEKRPDKFVDDIVLAQLRYSGMLETVRIRRAGYPVRRTFDDFIFRYRVLSSSVDEETEQCKELLSQFDNTATDWQLGSTKVFMRERLEQVLEKERQVAIQATVAKIQAFILGGIQRKRYLATRGAIIRIQAWAKAAIQRARYRVKRNAATKIAAVYKGYKARQLRAKLMEEKRIEEERIREEERRRQEEKRLELERLEREAAEAAAAAEEAEQLEAQRRLQEAKDRAEAEAKAKAEEEARKKAAEEESMKNAMAKAKNIEEAQKLAEEEAKRKAEEAKRLIEQAKRMKQAEEERKRAEEQAAKEAQLSEKEELKMREEMQMEEEEDDMGFEESDSEHKEGFLGLYQGVLKNLKKRWCVLHEGTFMWFKGKQDFIKAGWATKMGGGTSTLGRKNWKRRWFSLRNGELFYQPNEEEDASVLGIVDIQHCEDVSLDDGMKKENCLAVHTKKRTYFLYCETAQECSEWLEVLNFVKGASDDTIGEMMASARVDPRNAQGTIEVDDVLSVGPSNKTDSEGHPVFVVMTAERVYKFVAQDQDDMDDWVRALTPKRRGQTGGEATYEEATERGWMLKAGGKGNAFKRKRWFVLRGDVVSYYKNKGDEYTVGSIPLNSLCSVIPPDESSASSRNEWTFVVHSRHKSYNLTCKTQADCNRWINAIQDVIDNSPLIETPTEKLIDELKMASPQEVDGIYKIHKVLNYSSEPLRASLLPLPYGEAGNVSSGRTYGTLQEESLKISVSLLPIAEGGKSGPRYGSPASPVDLIKNIIQGCFDVPKLRNEVYCQVIKLTSNCPQTGSPLNLTHWHLLAALCCSFLPSRKFARYLRFHLRRTISLDNSGEDIKNVATFALEAIKKTKSRDFPPSTREIEGIMSGKGLTCIVSCVGGRNIELPILSSTTCGEVINRVKEQLNLGKCRNGFGLFESCGSLDKYLEEKYAVSDILSKWEKYEQHGINPDGGTWTLVFKLFSFYDPHAPDLSETERQFLFEQAFESVMLKRYPADDATQIQLAALRTQHQVGDWEEGAYISNVVKVHPAQQEQLLGPDQSSGATGTLKKAATVMKGTLRGFGMNTLRRLKGGTMKKDKVVTDAELQKIKDNIVKEWKKLRGMSTNDAMKGYMDIIRAWEGYGSNLFEVEQVSNKQWPKELWLAIGLQGVGVFPRGKRERLAFYKYETVLSFGAPVANKYKIMVDHVGSMLFETNMVLEIAKLMKEYIKEIVMRKR